ncbi:MAG: hypothetical protein JSR20_12770 [Nitrospira sp.]|nr:hypothetical protein [Nitrospira sp.]
MLEKPATRKGALSRPTVSGFLRARSFGANVLHANLFHSCVGLIILLLASACAAPPIQTRPIQAEATWFVRLDSVVLSERPSVQYQHPAHWNEQDLFAILSRLFLEQRVGMMDEPKPVRDVFSVEDLQQILPSVTAAFQQALPHEWVAFAVIGKGGIEDSEVTSGGLFQEAHRLHIVIANHRTPLTKHSPELVKIQRNPLYSVHGSGGVLNIEPRRYVLAMKANWSGGHRASANEMILDYDGYLAHLRLTDRSPVTQQTPYPDQPGETRPVQPSGSSLSDDTLSDPSAMISRLEREIQQLKGQLAEKERQVEQLKRDTPGSPQERLAPAR